MLNVKLRLVYRACVSRHTGRHLSTSEVQRAKSWRTGQNPGVGRRAAAFKDDPEFLQELDGEEDFDALESDYSQVEKSYDEHERETKKKKDKVQKLITMRKFFRPPKQPLMLTWHEKEQIRLLYDKDPEEWSVERLADSFPASKETITKVLRRRWTPESPEAAKRKDEKVYQNWKLLEEGKLEADPLLLEHLNKFTGRRENFLAQINSPGFYKSLTEGKKEEPPNWNYGQMKGILLQYERSLQELQAGNPAPDRPKELAAGTSELPRAAVSAEVADTVTKLEDSRPDNFRLGKKSQSGPQVTFSELKEHLKKKQAAGKSLDVTEQIILEGPATRSEELVKGQGLEGAEDEEVRVRRHEEGGKKEQGRGESAEALEQVIVPPREKASVTSRLLNLAGYQQDAAPQRVSTQRRPEVPYEHHSENDPTPHHKPGVLVVDSKPLEYPSDKEPTVQPVSKQRRPEVQMMDCKPYEYQSEKDREVCEAEERSLENSCFWSGEVPAPAAVRRCSPSDVVRVQEYPERIKVPPNKRGSGLTFKVNDCFYDDDGQFLYRVPGLTN